MRLPRSLRFAFAASSLVALAATAACSADSAAPGDAVAEEELNEAKSLGMTDVTILYPLPKTAEFFDDMLGPSSEGEKGELLPSDLFAQLLPIDSPPMIGSDGKPADAKRKLFADFADSFAYLRVVGVRLDPCFGESTNLGASSCANTIRLTAQFFVPKAVDEHNNPRPDGRASIHLFYQVSRADFTALAKSMLDLRKKTGLPLQKGLMSSGNGVHRTMNEEGLRGPYATALKELLLKYVGEQTLTQIAFCVQDRFVEGSGGYYNGQQRLEDNRWVFGRHEVKAGRIQALPIQTLDYTGLQTVDTANPTAERKLATIVTPAPRVKDDIFPAFDRTNQDAAKSTAARTAATRLQDPSAYGTNGVDCASCHMAKQAAPNAPNAFKSFTYRLEHTNDLIGPFRMFGYDSGGNPILTERVVNETVTVLDYLNKVVMK